MSDDYVITKAMPADAREFLFDALAEIAESTCKRFPHLTADELDEKINEQATHGLRLLSDRKPEWCYPVFKGKLN